MKVKRVLIVGTGIGGATAAVTLARQGFDVHCIDIKPERPTAGAGICLLHNTMRALETLGLADACRESGMAFAVFREFDASGQLQHVHPAPPSCGIRRPELARILETAAEDSGAVLEKGVTVQDLTDRGDRVDVQFSDGRLASYDLVVAADGVYSELRKRVFGTDYEPRFAGQSVWRFNAPRPEQADGFCLYRTLTGKVLGIFPTSRESCYMFYLESSREPLRIAPEHSHVLIRERLAEFDAPAIRDALDLITESSQVIFRPLDITLVPTPWHRGRVVLLGDAAHAPTPQMTSGAGMAVEDAVVLTECLAGSASAEEALAGYDQRRFERVKRIYDASLQLCLNEQEDSIGNKDRSAALLLETYRYLGQPI
ncbi:FAD-binding protein [Burkholderia sp. Bp9012]|uniref:FAD-dependent oxidoreductase n=1 Tax=Burkholderia sp. Bp9012 TaxID=2184562 RepID=UPI000F59EB41|nr:FAD-dependent oxidoreductase [Burkholderia sp. Bp9012]RQR85290.1 FAD-binding protein [Burkholderia sp. Bp9012]